jgi:histidinol-phosphate aminotransferase
MLDAATADTKLMFVCSPGNPTSKAIPLEDVEKLASSSRYDGIIVVDEAYVDFSPKGSAVSLVSKYPNIVVLQTLSKAFGLAGIRCGFAIGAPDVIQLMNNVKAPYNVNSLTSEVAINAMANIATLEKNVATLLEQREVVANALSRLEFVTTVYPSDANFILFRVDKNAKEIYKSMADGGVVTRYRGTEMHCDECIRVTVGTEEENKTFLERLAKTYSDLA